MAQVKEISRLEISEVPVNRQDYISYNSSNLFTAIDKGRNTKCQGAVTVPVYMGIPKLKHCLHLMHITVMFISGSLQICRCS